AGVEAGHEDSGCHFWEYFPDDHDSYFASDRVVDYAYSLADEIRPLKHLKRLHMGHYLTPTEALASHYAHHSNMRIHGSMWGPICELCTEEFEPATQDAEEIATVILGYEIPNLESSIN
ncbi:unnamed protein product, partial [Rhizoctonia solani]